MMLFQLLVLMILITVSATSGTVKPDLAVHGQNHTEVTVTSVPYYQLGPVRAAMVALGFGAVFLLALYLPAVSYRVCHMLGGCQSADNRVRRDDLIASLLSTARNIRVRNRRSAFEEPILVRLAKGYSKYAQENS